MNYDCIFLDRDGTINPDETGYINSLDDYSFYDFTLSALKRIAKANNRFCIMTNQSGVSRGLINEDDLATIHHFIKEQFKLNNIPLLNIYTNFDHPEEPTERRKPGPGMFMEAELDYGLNLMDCLMIGDSHCDMLAGEMLGMDTMLVLTGNGQDTLINLSDFEMPTYIVENLEEGANKICR